MPSYLKFPKYLAIRLVFPLLFCELYHCPEQNKRSRMAKPNYSFEKRQKEIAKRKKKEEKRQKKLAKNADEDQSASVNDEASSQ
ncbi:MAG TPA: hypothetical protein DHV53_09055 [Gammaproteobacteria bacterium]|nr:hypothetical protein [Gammaproteobacteria bacterium]HBJ89985.1 hypothetical protein [Gammaproteobacteria bacterium]HCI88784.1 hypothetical protein [Gammaproteobacteria bacterium]HCL71479.1 hypothetical protein [Gammaproteobacteria bacterium]